MAQDNKSQPVNGGGVSYGVTSIVTGIVALTGAWLIWISLPLAALAIIFGALGIKRPDSKGLAIAGLVTGSVAALIALVILFFWVLALTVSAPGFDATPTYYYR